jgi:hypothetical protein
MFSQHNEHPKEKVRVLVFVFRKNKALLESQRVVFCACQPEKEGAKQSLYYGTIYVIVQNIKRFSKKK